ncbi:DUF4136 domain-containing protein [Taibaiella soli]|uniref:DUF4136 domain-containing protein n=1 Tax=Taibaiella soli TaxID=1649169 RepID=A0A2W2BBN9_9BACT|nr:DUF4136 domain-containing protein [Taibaiella soli]PZF73629.1 hypothetical protein DN068_07860 [Taibaiella soli]
MIRFLKFIVLASMVMMMAPGCGSPLKVTTDYDKHVDFTKYKTYRINPVDVRLDAVSQHNKDLLRAAVISEMTKHGFAQDTLKPDIIVNIVTVIRQTKESMAVTDDYAYGGMYRPYYWNTSFGPPVYTTSDANQFKDGSIIIDMADASNQNLLWEGVGSAQVEQPLTNPEGQIKAVVKEIMKGFPPGKTKQTKN